MTDTTPFYFSLAHQKFWWASGKENVVDKHKLEQLEPLCSDDTPCQLMITHTIVSYWIPSQKKTKTKLQV